MRVRRKLRICNDRSFDNGSRYDHSASTKCFAVFFRVYKTFTRNLKRLACQFDAILFPERYLLNILFRNIRHDSAFDIVENSHL